MRHFGIDAESGKDGNTASVPTGVTSGATGHAAEAERQRALLRAILAPPDGGREDIRPAGFCDAAVPFARGLAAYRAHARASATRALASTFPTVLALLGEDNFQALAHRFLRQHPQRKGDLAEWGDELVAFIAAQAELRTWGYLADCALLDHAVQRCERALDAEFDAASMVSLSHVDPARLCLDFMPGTALIVSNWPLMRIHEAHALPEGDAREASFEQLREALAAPCGTESFGAVLVARRGWRAVVSPVGASDVEWTQHLLDGASLGRALAEASAAFDFNNWLTHAVIAGQLKGISVLDD